MNIPEVIELKTESEGDKPLSDVIVEMKVSAGRKNPYYIYFPKSDAAGSASLTKEEFIGQFKDFWEMGVMDYDGTPESADPIVVISLFDSSWLVENRKLALAWPLLNYERQKWDSRQEQYDYMVNNRNSEYSYLSLSVDVHKTQQIVFLVNEL